MLTIHANTTCAPLDVIEISAEKSGTLIVRDGLGRVYVEKPAAEKNTITVGGALGTHTVWLLNDAGAVVAVATFGVDCETKVEDSAQVVQPLLDNLRWTMESWLDGVGNDFMSRFDGKTYRYFVCWLRDHVHTLKGQKWFASREVQTAIELYAGYATPGWHDL